MVERRSFTVTAEIGRLIDEQKGKLSVSTFLARILKPSKRRSLLILSETMNELFHALQVPSITKKERGELETRIKFCHTVLALWIDRNRQVNEELLDNLFEFTMSIIQGEG